MPNHSAGAAGGCASAPAPQRDRTRCACLAAAPSAFITPVGRWSAVCPLSAQEAAGRENSQGLMEKLSSWAGLMGPEGWMPCICTITAVPKWAAGPSCRQLDRRETIFCVCISSSQSTCLKHNVLLQADLSLAMKMKLSKQTHSGQHLFFFNRS